MSALGSSGRRYSPRSRGATQSPPLTCARASLQQASFSTILCNTNIAEDDATWSVAASRLVVVTVCLDSRLFPPSLRLRFPVSLPLPSSLPLNSSPSVGLVTPPQPSPSSLSAHTCLQRCNAATVARVNALHPSAPVMHVYLPPPTAPQRRAAVYLMLSCLFISPTDVLPSGDAGMVLFPAVFVSKGNSTPPQTAELCLPGRCGVRESCLLL